MIIFPMAGASKRFLDAGYRQPKYYLSYNKKINLFQASVASFSKYFSSEKFLFIYREDQVTSEQLLRWCNDIGLNLNTDDLVPLKETTLGQAHTVSLGLSKSSVKSDERIIIFNIDSVYNDFRLPASGVSTFIDVAKMPGDHWSFVEVNSDKKEIVKRTTEKERISEYCSVGLYGFDSVGQYQKAYKMHYETSQRLQEHFIAPIYNTLIKSNATVICRHLDISHFEFLGTPDEYEIHQKRNK